MALTAMLAVALVLMVACTNLASLLLARAAGRRHETAVRLAMGASRARLLREQLVESAIIACGGGLGAFAVAHGVMTMMTAEITIGGGFPLSISPAFHGSVLAVAGGATLLALLVFGVAPAWRSTQVDVRELLAFNTSSALPRWRGRRALIAGQVAVSVLLVSMAALCIQQIRVAAAHDSGVDLKNLALLQFDFAKQKYDEPRARQIAAAVAEEARRLPRVEAVALASSLPSASGSIVALSTPDEGFPGDPRGWRTARQIAASPEIFRALGMRVLRGRASTEDDSAGAPGVVVITAATAGRLFGTADPLGREIVVRGRWAPHETAIDKRLRIVGITSNVEIGATGAPEGRGLIFVPFAQQFEATMCLIARTPGDPTPLVEGLRTATARVDRELAVIDAGTGLSFGGRANLMMQVMAVMSGLLGTLALLLAMIGLHGVLSHVVSHRTREVGLRAALGATRGRIIRMILRDGTTPVLAGIVTGLTVGGIARVAMRPLFVRMLPTFDPAVLVLVPALFLGAALVASYLPARRAARVDPNVALRHL